MTHDQRSETHLKNKLQLGKSDAKVGEQNLFLQQTLKSFKI